MNSNSFFTVTSNLPFIPNNRENNTNPLSQMKKYWCHLCKKDFSHIYDENTDIQCVYCGKTFCEIIENEDISNASHPIHFNPFVLNNNNTENNSNSNNNSNNRNNNSINNGILNRNHQRRNIFEITSSRRNNRIVDLITNYLIIQNNNDNIDDIITHIMLNDTNRYGNPPAAKKEVEKLKKYKIDEKKIKEFGFENSCAVCKDEFNLGEECLSMPCNHYFHENCILPWLKERNSCPICRYELPTDDADFEEMKKQKLNHANNGNNNVNSENIQ
jgi:hypothetical protein